MATSDTKLLQVRWSYYGCNEEDETRVADYWQNNSRLVTAKVSELEDPAGQLNVSVEHSDTEPQWTVQAALQMPGFTLVADGAGQTLEKALDHMLFRLAEQIDRREDKPVEVTRRREGIEALARLLESWRSQGRSEAFMSFLFPLAASLGPYIRRELQVREIHDQIPRGQVSPFEVLDELILEAWERFPERKPEQPLDWWLMQLANQAIERLGRSFGSESIDDVVPVAREEETTARQDEWVEQVSYFERVELSNLLPAAGGLDLWDQTRLETRRQHLAELLAGLSWEQRQAMVLGAVFGFPPAEIADFQGRPVEEVESDLAASRTNIRRIEESDENADLDVAESYERKDLRRERKRHSGQR